MSYGLTCLTVLSLVICTTCIKVPERETPVTLTVSKESLSFAASGEQQTFSVTSNANWTVNSDASWVTVSPPSFDSIGKVSESNETATVTVIATSNTAITPRTASITINSNIPGVTEQTVNVTQAGVTPSLSVSTSSISFAASGEQKTFSITSNVAWTIASSQSWCTIQPASGNGNSEITVSAAENTAATTRTAILTVTAGNLSRQVTIQQVSKNEGTVPVTSIALNKNTLSLVAGASETLTATISPSNATNKTVTWTSSNPSVASVNNSGLVTAISAGSATIIATTQDGGKTATCAVTVTAQTVSVTGITLDRSTLTMNIGNKQTLTATIQPANATNKTVNWTSTNNAVATVNNNGEVSALASGTVNIIATTQDGGKTATCSVTVNSTVISVTSVTLNKNTLTLLVNASEKLIATVLPADATNKTVNWSSSAPNVATVANDGTVTAVTSGQTTITVTTQDGNKTAICVVTVTAQSVPVTGITLDRSTLTMDVGNKQTLTATIQPANATNKTVNWTSSNNAVATVSNAGEVSALASGTVNIIATTQDGGKTATCTITVNPTVTPVTSVSLNKSTLALSVNTSEKLIATTQPANATNKNVTWSSSAPNVATVANDGTVTAVTSGQATITVTTQDGNKTAACVVTVTAQTVSVTGVSLDKSTLTMDVGNKQTLTATIQPTNATNKTVNWTSSNNAVATVNNNGEVSALASGTVNIIATTQDGGKTATCTITVNPAVTPVTSVSLNKSTLSLIALNSEKLIATVLPTTATNKNVTWVSNNTYVATVANDGTVTAWAAGTANITVTTVDGAKMATCVVTVTAANVAVTGVSLNKTALTLNTGNTETLTATIMPANATNTNVTWTSSNSNVAMVNSSGFVTAVASGSSTITVTTVDGGRTASCLVTVIQETTGSSKFENGITAANSFGGGNGTQGSPYLINNAQQLKKLIDGTNVIENYYTNTYFKLNTNIEVTTDEWKPIGDSDYGFRGIFDGNGHYILGTLKSNKYVRFGFFGILSNNARVTNLTIAATVRNDNISSSTITGAVAGIMNGNAFISDCHIIGIAVVGGAGTFSNTGGIVGIMSDNSRIQNSDVSSLIYGGAGYTGGVVGSLIDNTVITNCIVSASASITGGYTSISNAPSFAAGGIAGHNSGTIINCTNNASVSVSRTDWVGGITGENVGIIHTSLNTGNVTGINGYTGGLSGINYDNAGSSHIFSCNTNRGTVNGQAANTSNQIGSGKAVEPCPDGHTKR